MSRRARCRVHAARSNHPRTRPRPLPAPSPPPATPQDEAAAAPNLKLLEMAHKWKRQKTGEDGGGGGDA